MLRCRLCNALLTERPRGIGVCKAADRCAARRTKKNRPFCPVHGANVRKGECQCLAPA